MTKKRILLVDDDKVVRLVLGQGLRKNGYEVLEAENGVEALALCATERVDLAIVDYKMPEMSGLELAEALRRLYELPFLFLTVYKDETIVHQAIAQGAHSYLVKPVAIEDLLRQVEAALERSAEAKHLGRALTETQLINVALGILMAERRISRDRAHARLRSLCRPRGERARDVAANIVECFEATLAARAPFDALIGEDDKGRN